MSDPRGLPRWASALDYLAILLAIVTLTAIVGGGFRVNILGVRLSVTEWWRPALFTLLALGIRHALVRQTPLPQRVWSALRRWWTSPETRVLLPIHLATRAGVLAVGFLGVVLIGLPPDPGGGRWQIYDNVLLDLPGRWDTGWYLGIAIDGYEWNPARPDLQQNIAFFPAMPMSVRYLSELLGHQPLWTAVALSLVCFYGALVYLLRLGRDHLADEGAAVTAVALLACYPFALFFSAAYTEGLFLLTLTGAVYHFRRGELWRAAWWGLIAGLTRPNGCFLSVVLGLMALEPLWKDRRGLRAAAWSGPGGLGPHALRLAAAAAPGLGMIAYSTYVYVLTGNPLQWAAQNAAWGRVYRGIDLLIADRVSYIYQAGFYRYAADQPLDLLYALSVLFILGAVWPVYRRFGLPYAAMLIVNVLPPVAAGGLLSMGRVTSVLFPAFLWMAAAIPVHHRIAWIVVFAVLQGFAAVMFFTWRPLF